MIGLHWQLVERAWNYRWVGWYFPENKLRKIG